ncbi:MAG TPA: flagellar hook-associated protein FlgL [Steroidobacteraceae bacterium]|nr:flagellar hook-associated protein FlgL [Steroidobacteraceae bacterium]
MATGDVVPISTTTFQTNALNSMEALEAAMSKTQEQLSTGNKIQTAADDPTGMAQVNQLNMELSASQQYVTNGNLASANLSLETQALSDATNLLQSARDLAVEANDAALTASQRQDIATQLAQQLQQLVSIGNRTDSSGNFLFSGYASSTQPFSQNGNSVSYAGADQVNQVQISENQRLSAGDTGSSVFMNVPAGNGTFTTATGAANTGTASIGPGTVTNPSQWVPDTYTVTFTDPTDYTVTNGGGATVTSGTYDPTTGGTISFNGIQVTLSGNPASNDTFTVAPAGQSSAFATLSGLITTLNSTTPNAGQTATQISQAIEQIDGAINNLGNVSAAVGGRVNAVTSSQSSAQTRQTDLKSSISDISSTDYAAATTQLSGEEVALQAAEESYASLAKLSLFNYVS